MELEIHSHFSFILDDGYVVSSGWDRMGGQVPEPGAGDVAYKKPLQFSERDCRGCFYKGRLRGFYFTITQS